MKHITLSLRVTEDPRPIVHIENFFEVRAMLDTGAVLPVWTEDKNVLQAFGGVKVREKFNFSGFGGKAEGTLYRIPTFTLGELTFPHLPIVAVRMSEPYHMILSATMFSRLIYEIDDYRHKLNITVPDGESTTRNIAVREVNGRLKIVLAND